MLCLLVMCSMEELQEFPPSSTVLGNLGISWSAGVMDCVLCALNSEIMSFSRFAPQHPWWWRRDNWREGAASCVSDIRPRDWLPVTSFYYSAWCLHFSFPLWGPLDRTQLRGAQRRAHLGTAGGEQAPLGLLELGEGAQPGSWAYSKVKAQPFRNLLQKKTWRLANGNHMQRNSRVSNTHGNRRDCTRI